MPGISEKLGYIHGMMEGLKLNKDDDSVKLLYMMADVLDSLSESVAALENDHQELCDYVESIDDDLTDLEMHTHAGSDDFDDLYDYEETDDEEIDFAPARRGHLRILKDTDEEEEFDEAETEFYIGCVCPECGKFFSVKDPDNYPDDQKFICPFCKKHVSIEPMNPEKVPCAKPAPDPGEIPF